MNQNIFKPLNNGWHQEKVPFFSFSKHDYFLLKKKNHLLDLPTITSESHLTKCYCFHFIVNFTLLYINTCTQIQYKTLISTCCAKHIIILIHKKVTTVTVLTLTQSLKLLPIHTTSHHQKTNILPHMNSMGSYHKLLTWLSLELFSGGVNFIIC